jgi:hypothetical protein
VVLDCVLNLHKIFFVIIVIDLNEFSDSATSESVEVLSNLVFKLNQVVESEGVLAFRNIFSIVFVIKSNLKQLLFPPISRWFPEILSLLLFFLHHLHFIRVNPATVFVSLVELVRFKIIRDVIRVI